MYQQAVLGSAEAMAALNAMLEEASTEPDRPVAIAVVDSHGELVCFARMDRVGNVPREVALRKAYTAGRGGFDNRALGEMCDSMGIPLASLDPRFIALAGGVVLKQDGQVVGGIGVSGRHYEEDEALARKGAAFLGLAPTA